MQNTKALSVAYGVSENVIEDMNGLTFPDDPPRFSGLDYQNRLVKSMLSESGVNVDVFKGITASMSVVDCTRSTSLQYGTNHYWLDKSGNDPKAVFDFTAPANGPIYVHFNVSRNFGYSGKVYVKKNNSSAAYVADEMHNKARRFLRGR